LQELCNVAFKVNMCNIEPVISSNGIPHITLKVVDTFCRDAGIPASIYVSRHFAWEHRTPVRQL
jgi:hypothetical protein